MVIRGDHKGREGKVTSVYRKKWSIYIEKLVRDKANGSNSPPPPSLPSRILVLSELFLNFEKFPQNLLMDSLYPTPRSPSHPSPRCPGQHPRRLLQGRPDQAQARPRPQGLH